MDFKMFWRTFLKKKTFLFETRKVMFLQVFAVHRGKEKVSLRPAWPNVPQSGRQVTQTSHPLP